MKLTIGTAHELITNMRTYFQVNSPKQNYTTEEPLRAELFSSDQMDHYGKTLAGTHKLSADPVHGHLLNRLSDNEKVLNEVRKLLVDAIKKKRLITPAGEWLIDNFYLIEEQIRTAKKHLPKGYSKTLPQLANEDTPGLTRVYDIALRIISHSDGRIDLDRLSRFIKSYQSVAPLHLGELWAIPIMLRLTLIENLRRVSALIAIDLIDKNLANYWAKQMLDTAENDPKNLILITADMARLDPPMVSAFVSEMNRQLLGKGAALALPLTWIEQRLAEEGRTSNELVNAEIQKQAINQVSVSNSIGSLRLLSSLDWRDFVETHSVVEQTLRTDNNEVYARMDFSTRDSYRHVVEQLAKQAKIPENDVALIAIKLANAPQKNNLSDGRKAHVGYYLLDKGIGETQKELGIKPSFYNAARQLCRDRILFFYLGAIFLIAIIISGAFLIKAYEDATNYWLLVLIGVLLLLASSQLAMTLVNFFSTLLVRPRPLPRMDFAAAIPDDCSTLVVIPTMLTSPSAIEELVEALEVRFLANKDEHLCFGLLTDFIDAHQEELPEDGHLLQLVKERIEDLKQKYETGTKSIFFLFHRPRQWNGQEKIWMGYERKRGKLSELNSLLRGHAQDRFSCIVGDLTSLQQVKYVITLDSDTQLPRGAAWKMIATMAHPLNRPLYSEKRKRVTEGYGILQPRVTVSLPESHSSFYNRLHGNEPGIDPYTRATSDVYQDLFGEGSFIGKGIYEIDTFERTLKGRFRENRILSHDLLEGCYVRSGLISDVELYEKYPMSYRSDMKRRSRWIRGDWQIFSWFLPYVPGADRHWHKNPLSTLSRWKIYDNIRRSLIPISLTVLTILGWTLLSAPLFWTIAVLGTIVFPIFVTLIWDAFKKPKDIIFLHHVKIILNTTSNIIVQTLFTMICLPYEAYLNMMSIKRAVWRMIVSHRKLLEWDPFTTVEHGNQNSIEAYYSAMWIAPFLGFTLFVFLSVHAPLKIIIAWPILFLWIVAPFIIWLASKLAAKQKALLSNAQDVFLLKVARKTWAFFERFVDAEDNWLPPDNFQEYPVPVVAHRTSPTNIGLSLLANLSANDFGYISVGQFLDRTASTMKTMQQLERYRGHFYNWYDTESLQPLPPKYISTVDSGNLAGHLLTLRQGIFEILHQKMVHPKIFNGLTDTLLVLKDLIGADNKVIFPEFTSILETACRNMPVTLDDINTTFKQLSESYNTEIKITDENEDELIKWWKQQLRIQIEATAEEFQIFAPWVSLSDIPQQFAHFTDFDTNSSLSDLNDKITKTFTELSELKTEEHSSSENEWLSTFKTALATTQERLKDRISFIEQLGHDCIGLADMEWDFLYDKTKHLLTIGYKVDDHACDPGFYDLLASEARLCTFVAIAQGKLSEENWFALGRLLTNVNGDPILLSWSGSMFEYLMPLLVMPTYENTLLDQTYKAVVRRQIEYGRQRGIPWGISESGYNMVDAASNYQYLAFGVPGLGLKRGLDADLVIAPYATALSLMVAPEASCENLQLLSEQGFQGAYGFYEAIDYTQSRLQRGQTNAVIQSFMAHHQGMSLLSLNYLMNDQPMQRRFEAEPQFQATLLLLQERIPKTSSFYAHTTDIADFTYTSNGTEIRIINTPNTPIPEVQLLSNGKYHVMVTNAGGGYSRWKDIAITRWREDATCDNWGMFCYIRDVDSGEYWSNAYQPTLKKNKFYEAAFSQGRVDFHNTNSDIETHTEIVISPEDDIEMRRVHITNKSGTRRTIEITSYSEVVLAAPMSDAMQPAFSNLFVETEILPQRHAIICSRRPRSVDEHTSWMFHSMMAHGVEHVDISYETDRAEFIGRGNTGRSP